MGSLRKKRLDTGGVILAIGAAFFGFGVAGEPIRQLGFAIPHFAYILGLICGMVFIVIGLLLVTAQLCSPIFVVVFPRRDIGYESEPAATTELKDVREFAASFFGEDGVTELRQMEQWAAVNAHIFWKVIEVKKQCRKEVRTLVGYYCLIPLNRRASQLVENEELNGMMFTREHIIKQRRGQRGATPSSLYIGAVAAKERDKLARAATIKHLMDHIDRCKRMGVTVVYTRPITEDGLRLVEQNGFSPVAQLQTRELKRIYKVVYQI